METHFQFSPTKFIMFPYLFYISGKFNKLNYGNKLKERNEKNINMQNNVIKNNINKRDISNNIKVSLI